jgi:hypothetical protein
MPEIEYMRTALAPAIVVNENTTRSSYLKAS